MSVLDNNFNGTLVPLIETSERYIMQGQVYGKEDMKFEFMNFLPVNAAATFHMPSLIRRCTSFRDTETDANNYTNKRTYGDMVTVDNNDPTVSYSIVDSYGAAGNTAQYTRIIKTKTENDHTEMLWNVGFNDASGTNNYSSYSAIGVGILGQSDKYILVVLNTSGLNTYSNYARFNQFVVKRFDKATGAYSDVFDYNKDRNADSGNVWYGNGLRRIAETNSNIYFSFYNGVNNAITIDGIGVGQTGIYRYDKIDDTRYKIGTIQADPNRSGNAMITSQGIVDGDRIYVYQYTRAVDPSIRLITIDTVTQTHKEEIVIATFNDKIKAFPSSQSSDPLFLSRLTIELFIKKIDGKNYLNIMGHSTRAAVSSTDFNRITTFLIDDETHDLIAQDYCDPFNDTAIRGVIDMIDENLMLVTNRLASKVLRFDTIKGKYVEIQVIDIPNNAIGCDSKNNIWICDTNYLLHKFTVELPVDVQLSFEKDSIDYKGVDVNTNILLEAYNYKNERVGVKLELTIKGPMTFADGSKIITTSSSKTERVKIPAIVKGSGIISVFPKILL